MDVAAAWLLAPISEDEPCGESLEDTLLLASFDAYRVFGRLTLPKPKDDRTRKTGDEPPIDWHGVRAKAEGALRKSKDFRLLSHYAMARLYTEGLLPFCETITVAAQWLETYPDQVYPQTDDDVILRRNALNNFCDPTVAVDALRRMPFVTNPAIGAFSLRDVEIAKGKLTPAADEGDPATEAQINGALSAVSSEELATWVATFAESIDALKKIDRLMRDKGGSEAAPDTERLLEPVSEIHLLMTEQLAQRVDAASPGSHGDTDGATGAQGVAVGNIRSREDAMRALDAIAMYFRKNEPSSPVPLFLERAKRLVAKDFLEVLADIAPEALGMAKQAGGIRDE